MRTNQKSLFALLLVLLLGSVSSSAWANVGRVLYTFGTVNVEKPAISTLRRGNRVEEGDVIVTGPKGYAQIKLKDGTKIAVRPDSRFEIEAVEAPATATQPAIGAGTALRARFKLQKGGFRTITGGIAKRDPGAYQVSTPSAVIRVRGTNYVARVCAADCAGTGDGLYVGVSNGGVSLSNNGGDLNLSSNQFGYAANFNSAPRRLVAPPATLREEGLAELEEEESEEESSSDEEKAAEESSEESAEESSSESSESAESAESADSASSGDASAEGTTDSSTESLASDRSGTVSGSAASTSSAATTTTTPVTTDVNEPEQEIVAQGTGGQPVDLTGGEKTFVPRGFAFALANNLKTVTNSETVVLNTAGNLTGFDVTGSDGAQTRFDIGTAVNKNNGFDANSQLKWGRWADGVATEAVGSTAATNVSLDSQSLHYVLASSADVIPTRQITGSASYTLVGNTDPTDNLGNVGVLGSATLSADFTNQTVQNTLQLGISNQVWTATGTGSININLFSGLYDTVSVDGLSGGAGNFNGIFAGFSTTGTPTGAGLTYELSNGDSTVNGAAVFGSAL